MKRLLFAVVPAVVLLGGAELGLGALGWPTPTGNFEHNEPFWTTDAGLRSKAFPHKETGGNFQVTTDQRGLRWPLHDVKRNRGDGTWRVMALGCSTTFGWGVDDEESYPAKLEQIAREGGYGRLQVINGGQPGYTSFQGRWLWDSVLHRYEPDVVLIGYVVQDARKAAYTDKSQALIQRDHRFLKDNMMYRSRLYLGLRAMIGGVQVRAKERGSGDAGGAYRVPPEDYADNIRGLVDGVRKAGGQPVLFGFPLEREGYTSDHRTILRAAAEHLGVPLFNPQADMEAASRDATLYFVQDRGHANAAGNALIAQWVFTFLEGRGFLGPT